VVREVVKRLAGQEPNNVEERKESDRSNKEDDDEDNEPDMRSVLGFLNQNEWVQNLNIGNIMQISSISMQADFLRASPLLLPRETVHPHCVLLLHEHGDAVPAALARPILQGHGQEGTRERE
jgi:hypothetical protein